LLARLWLTCFFVAVAKRRRRDSSSETEPPAKKPRSIPARPSNTQTAPADVLEHDAELLAGGHELGNAKKFAWMERGEKCVKCVKKGLRCIWPIFPEEKRLPSKRPLSRCWECTHSPSKERCYTEAHDALLEAWKAEYDVPKKRKSAKGKGVAQSRETVSDSDDECRNTKAQRHSSEGSLSEKGGCEMCKRCIGQPARI